MKPRRCPHCKKQLPLQSGFHFDENLNMICDNCNKVVVSVGPTPTNPPKKDVQPKSWDFNQTDDGD